MKIHTQKSDVTNQNFFRILDKKQYELKDHLGNVRVAIGDMKIPTGTRGLAPFVVDEKSVSDFYPGGMSISDRSWQGTSYRYGYNAQEKSLEIDASGNHHTAEFWEVNNASLRRWNRDPKPIFGISEYSIFANNPIRFNDLNGDLGGPSNFKARKYFMEMAANNIKGRVDATNQRIKKRTETELKYGEISFLKHSRIVTASIIKNFGDLIGWDDINALFRGKDLKTGEESTTTGRVIAGAFIAIDVTTCGLGKKVAETVVENVSESISKKFFKRSLYNINSFIQFGSSTASDVITRGLHIKANGNHFLFKIIDNQIVLQAAENNVSDATMKKVITEFKDVLKKDGMKEAFKDYIDNVIKTMETSASGSKHLEETKLIRETLYPTK